MPGTTPLGIRFPTLPETVSVTAWQNMATDIDALLTQVNTLRDLARLPQYGEVQNTGSISVTVATGTDITWNFEVEDNGGLVDLVANSDRITVGTGVWLVQSYLSLLSMTTITAIRNSITVNGTLHTSNKVSSVSGSPGVNVSTLGCVVATAAGTILRTRLTWNGTGGPANGTGRMWALKLREL